MLNDKDVKKIFAEHEVQPIDNDNSILLHNGIETIIDENVIFGLFDYSIIDKSDSIESNLFCEEIMIESAKPEYTNCLQDIIEYKKAA